MTYIVYKGETYQVVEYLIDTLQLVVANYKREKIRIDDLELDVVDWREATQEEIDEFDRQRFRDLEEKEREREL